MKKKSKVLIVDDSRVYRRLLVDALKEEEGIEVIALAENGEEAMQLLEEGLKPDVITLDIEMPVKDGLQTLREVQKLNQDNGKNIACIMVSSHTQIGSENTIQSLELGAFDFVTKPDCSGDKSNLEILRKQLVTKIKCQQVQSNLLNVEASENPKLIDIDSASRPVDIIAIGCSTGGPRALMDLLPKLSEKISLPIVIVQHMPPKFTLTLAESLDKKCKHNVIEVTKEEAIVSNKVYIAAGGSHMIVKKNGGGKMCVAPNYQEPLGGCRPSVDMLFKSLSVHYGKYVLSLMLTGMGNDGEKGMRSLKRAGAYNIAQDEKSSVVWGMPGSVVESGVVHEVLSLESMAEYIENLIAVKVVV